MKKTQNYPFPYNMTADDVLKYIDKINDQRILEIIDMRLKGYSYSKIAKIKNTSRQYIHQSLKDALFKASHEKNSISDIKELKLRSRLYESYAKTKTFLSFEDFKYIYEKCLSKNEVSPIILTKRIATKINTVDAFDKSRIDDLVEIETQLLLAERKARNVYMCV